MTTIGIVTNSGSMRPSGPRPGDKNINKPKPKGKTKPKK
jgi:hypothetical protein